MTDSRYFDQVMQKRSTSNLTSDSHGDGSSSNPTWKDYFDESRDLFLPNSSTDFFRVYQVRNDQGPLYVFHHGGGHTALTWSLVVKHLRSLGPCSVLCYDARGHGATTFTNEQDESDLSLDRLSQDLATVVQLAYPEKSHPKDVVLVGHSLGGAVVVDAAQKRYIQPLVGVVVLDVVEGTAMESLIHMNRIIRARPSSFKSLDAAIKWAVSSQQVKNIESATISTPPQLRCLPEKNIWIWRTNLAATEPYWKGWFENMSEKFLTSRCARLLILAGTDRLDKALTIGQMQGKFQLQIFPECGHGIPEDAPEKLASSLHEFWDRNQPLKVIKRFPIPVKPSP